MFDELFSFFGLFQIVCFVLLLLYLKKLIITYLRPELYKEIVRRKRQLDELKKEQKHLAKVHTLSLQETEAKTHTAENLLKKIRTWHKVMDRKHKIHEQSRVNSQKQVKNYLEEQARLLSIDHAKKEIIPEAVEQVLQDLRIKFSTQKEREEFLKNILIKMNEEYA
ncbi:hypothetical protein K9K77_00215 [Candidatus Babeliales bacterium]|nr:hypothetical protein [Candidatus Babeliales bacterium]